MAYRPLIAVVAYELDPGRVARWPRGGYGVPLPYLERLRAAGSRTAILSPGEEGDPDELLSPFDGLVLVGGGDVDPARYGATADTAHNYGPEPVRDVFEIDLLHAAHRMRLPTLCICRGMQVVNVAFGGTLHQHLPDIPGLPPHGVPVDETTSTHEVEAAARSRLWAATKTTVLSCSSHHHQAIEVDAPLGDDSEPWMLGVQWHPEDTADTDPAQQALFDRLVVVAQERASAS